MRFATVLEKCKNWLERPSGITSDIMKKYKPVLIEGLPIVGGAVGYINYDTVRFLKNTLPIKIQTNLNLPI